MARRKVEWVAQVSLFETWVFRWDRSSRRNPGLKSETWATHLKSGRRRESRESKDRHRRMIRERSMDGRRPGGPQTLRGVVCPCLVARSHARHASGAQASGLRRCAVALV